MKTALVGWIGAGKMGGPMIRRLIAMGHTVWVFDLDSDNLVAAIKAGAHAAADVNALCGKVDIIFSTIPNDDALQTIALGVDGLAAHMRPGSTFVEMSTVSPAISKQIAAAMDGEGVNYLRAPVSGSTVTAASGGLTIMASGSRAAFERVEDLLSAFSARRFYVGDAEQARYLKLVVNTLVGATSSLLSEALALGKSGGLSQQDMLAVISESAVASPLIGYKRDMILSGDYEAAFSVEQMIKDFDLIIGAARDAHVPMFLAALIRQQYEEAHTAGYGGRDFFVLCQDKNLS